MQIQIGKYSFICQMKSVASLPDYKGSTIRGGLGQALKQLVCTLSQMACAECLLNKRCIYALFFESDHYFMDKKDARFPVQPSPYVIEPPLENKQHYQPGDFIEFHLMLFGEANAHLPYIIYAIDQMGDVGLGKKINGSRGLFYLHTVKQNNQVIFSHQDRKIQSIPPDIFSIETFASDINASQINVTFETPLRFKFNNRLNTQLPFHILVRAMIRRLTSLFNCYAEGEPRLNYKQLIEDAHKVSITHENLYWFDWNRYSSRQSQTMTFGGIKGDISYSGDLTPYLPFLTFCETVHVGKQTSFGLGKLSIKNV